jgi:Oxidoreductase family, C-terminal alpha/beta domain
MLLLVNIALLYSVERRPAPITCRVKRGLLAKAVALNLQMLSPPPSSPFVPLQRILAVGSCHIDSAIRTLPGPEAYDTATIVVEYENGRTATIDVCRQAPYGYDQRAEALGTKGMIQTDNMYPNTVRTAWC